MPGKINVTAVSYLNTKPLLYGIFKSDIADEIDLQLDIPSVCAQKLKAGTVDFGLVPVAIIPELDSPRIISDYCIGSVGAVQTVAIFSEEPLERVRRLFLDYHSRTSVELVKVLLRDYWQHEVEFVPATPGFETQIQGVTAGLVIGDRAIGLENRYPFVYDLGEAWLKHTGLPFVFAAWVSNKELDPGFVNRFNQALQKGLSQIPQLIYLLPSPQPGFDLEHYFTHNISYHLDFAKRRGLAKFLELISGSVQPTVMESLQLTT